MLKYNEDWSYHALAEHLGISHSAVEARLHRARQRLRTELAALHCRGRATRLIKPLAVSHASKHHEHRQHQFRSLGR